MPLNRARARSHLQGYTWIRSGVNRYAKEKSAPPIRRRPRQTAATTRSNHPTSQPGNPATARRDPSPDHQPIALTLPRLTPHYPQAPRSAPSCGYTCQILRSPYPLATRPRVDSVASARSERGTCGCRRERTQPTRGVVFSGRLSIT